MADVPVDALIDDAWIDSLLSLCETPQPIDAPEDLQLRKPPAPSKGKKRRLNDADQPRPKRQRLQHSHVCELHRAPDSKPFARCFGKWSIAGPYKGARCDRNVTTVVDDQLPVCSSHRAQAMKMVRCQGPLSCGLPCNEIAQWKPHGYPLCDDHWSQGKCYFLDTLPAEVRLMIYRYLAPDQPVPSRSCSDWLRRDRVYVTTALLRVNKTIHDEYVDVFYGETTFKLRVVNAQNKDLPTEISMCYARWPTSRVLSPKQSPLLQYDLAPWKPSLAQHYFERIRSFHIEIMFDITKAPAAASSTSAAESMLAEADRNLICDQLHRLVDCLSANEQLPLRTLALSVRIQGLRVGDDTKANAEGREHCLKLMNPLRRLRSRTAAVVSFARTSITGEVNLLSASSGEVDSAAAAVRRFCTETTGASMPPQKNPVLVRFAQMADIISQMAQHPFWRDSDKVEMECFLNHGRSAREKNDMKAMTTAFNDVIEKLKRFHSDHQTFITRMHRCLVQMRPESARPRSD
jgi:hypothetical protein